MLLFCLVLGKIQRLYHIINVVRYLDRYLTICTISPMILINTTCSEFLFKARRPRKRSQEEDKGGEGLLIRYVGRGGKKFSIGKRRGCAVIWAPSLVSKGGGESIRS